MKGERKGNKREREKSYIVVCVCLGFEQTKQKV